MARECRADVYDVIASYRLRLHDNAKCGMTQDTTLKKGIYCYEGSDQQGNSKRGGVDDARRSMHAVGHGSIADADANTLHGNYHDANKHENSICQSGECGARSAVVHDAGLPELSWLWRHQPDRTQTDCDR